jgi:hypothetical protein
VNLTTIAYRDGVMAGDSCWQANNLQTTSMTKVTKLSSGSLFGAAGDGDIRALLTLLDKIRLLDRMPSRADLAALRCDVQAIWVFPQGQISMIAIAPGGLDGDNLDHYDAQIWPANRGFAAVGTGAELAIGAMAAGKDARHAVGIACKFDINSRLPIHSVELRRR